MSCLLTGFTSRATLVTWSKPRHWHWGLPIVWITLQTLLPSPLQLAVVFSTHCCLPRLVPVLFSWPQGEWAGVLSHFLHQRVSVFITVRQSYRVYKEQQRWNMPPSIPHQAVSEAIRWVWSLFLYLKYSLHLSLSSSLSTFFSITLVSHQGYPLSKETWPGGSLLPREGTLTWIMRLLSLSTLLVWSHTYIHMESWVFILCSGL